jgi:lipopolysaccharide transport system ATP-binding protein
MSAPSVVFDGVWKQFHRGERHDSLRDLIPSTIRRLLGKPRETSNRDDADAFWALKDVSFEVRPGEALGIIGRNGAGKSTALKLLTRILKPTSGTALVRGRNGALIEVAAGFHPDLTGRENIYLQGAIMGMRRDEIAARFDDIIDFAGIERFVDTQVKRYSSGMNARLGFSIAAHLNPDVLLIDEVLAVGDLLFQEKCYARMKKFRSEGAALVFVSHNLPAVAELCDRVLLLEQGETVELGPPADVISRYCTGLGSSQEDDVAIQATLTRSDDPGTENVWEVEPGEHLTLDVTIDFRTDTDRASVGVAFWDLRRELYVYGVSSDLAGIPLFRARAGDQRRFTFTFEANLTRGLYVLEVNVVDADQHRFLGRARGIRQFQVVEHVSYDGVANLYLRGREHTGRPPQFVPSLVSGGRAAR